MKSLNLVFLIVSALAFSIVGCCSLGGGPTSPAGTTTQALPEGLPSHLTTCNYGGSWETNWGEMNLTQNGNAITGTYVHDTGRLDGGLVDGVFVGKWSEAPSYSEPNDAGDVVLYFGGSCDSFTGLWAYGVHEDGKDWQGTFEGSR